MKEARYLEVVAKAYRINKLVPVVISENELPDLTKMCVRVLCTDESQDPPIGDIVSVEYYVLKRGKVDEEVFSSRSNSGLVSQSVKECTIAVAAEKGEVVLETPVVEKII